MDQWRIQDFLANSPGAPTYDFAKFSRKLHGIEKIWVPGGHAPLALNPPLWKRLDNRKEETGMPHL